MSFILKTAIQCLIRCRVPQLGKRLGKRGAEQDAAQWIGGSCRPKNRRCSAVRNSTRLWVPRGHGARRLGGWSLLGCGRLLLLLSPYTASHCRRNDNHEDYNGDNNDPFPCAVEGWTGATSLKIAAGLWGSRLFYQKVGIITTLSKCIVRFGYEEQH